MSETNRVFLKLGGSLVTDKSTTATAHLETIARLAVEIRMALTENPGLNLLLGHGSGSFGHVPAKAHQTRRGVSTPAGWQGFGEVWHQAARLNRIVIDALRSAGLNAVSFPPSAAVVADNGRITEWDGAALAAALAAGLLPVVFGDVAFDRSIGGTIVSTEDVFAFLALRFRPQRILIAGVEAGVWADYPACTRLVEVITPDTFPQFLAGLYGSPHTDVTGGMENKVQEMLALAKALPGTEILIFGGEEPGAVSAVLAGQTLGTRILS